MMYDIQSRSDFLHEFESFSNLTIICSDGLMFSHKVVLASISSYIKQLLSQFPPGDEVTIYLPDYTRSRVESFVTSKVFKDTQYEEDLARHFKAVKPLNGFRHCEIEAKTEVEEDLVEHLEENEGQVPNDAQEIIEKQQMHEDVSELTKEENDDTQQDMNGFLEDMTPAQISELRLTSKKIKYEKAVKEFESGRATSYCQAAKKFGVSHSTLRRKILQTQRKEFTGGGRVYPLTFEEQNALKDTILLATNNGKDLTFKQIRDFMAEEVSNIVHQYPERSEALSKYIDPTYDNAFYFAKKHGLDKIINKSKKKEERKIYECDICASSFTFKNSMIFHKRTVHLYFLKNN